MTVEQSPEHNRYVDASIPFTWGYFFRQLKLTLPLWVFSFVCLMELGILRAWSAGRLNLDFVLTLLGVCMVLGVFILATLRLQLWLQHRSKRVLRLKKHWVSLNPSSRQLLRWKHVAKFQFEPLPELPGATKLKLFSADRTTRRPLFTMVLANHALLQELIANLQARRTQAGASFEIDVLKHPEPSAKPGAFPTLGFSLGIAGIYFLLHGMPLLILWLTRGQGRPASKSSMAEEVRERLGRWIANHFSSVDAMDWFVLWSGLGLCFVGLLLLFFGWRLIRVKPVEANPRDSQAPPQRLTLP